MLAIPERTIPEGSGISVYVPTKLMVLIVENPEIEAAVSPWISRSSRLNSTVEWFRRRRGVRVEAGNGAGCKS